MSLYVDIELPGFTASNIDLRVINVSSTSSRAYYSVDFFAHGERVRVPIEKYFTFGEPRGFGLLRYAASEGVRVHVRDDAASMHQQCYDDLRHRFSLGLLPWVTAMREGDEDIERVEPPQMVAPEPPPEPVVIETHEPDPAPSPEPVVPEPNDPVTDALVPEPDEGVAVFPPLQAPHEVDLYTIHDLDFAKAILLQRVSAEAARRSGLSLQSFMRSAQLNVIILDPETSEQERRDAQLEAQQAADRAASGLPFEQARAIKAAEIVALLTIEAAWAYNINTGWPE